MEIERMAPPCRVCTGLRTGRARWLPGWLQRRLPVAAVLGRQVNLWTEPGVWIPAKDCRMDVLPAGHAGELLPAGHAGECLAERDVQGLDDPDDHRHDADQDERGQKAQAERTSRTHADSPRRQLGAP